MSLTFIEGHYRVRVCSYLEMLFCQLSGESPFCDFVTYNLIDNKILFDSTDVVEMANICFAKIVSLG